MIEVSQRRADSDPVLHPSLIIPEDGQAIPVISNGTDSGAADAAANGNNSDATGTGPTPAEPQYRPRTFVLLEALAATGLRSIRYAREIPLLKKVIANDLSASAVRAMKRNVALNFPADRPIQVWDPLAEQQQQQQTGETQDEAEVKVEAGDNAAVNTEADDSAMAVEVKTEGAEATQSAKEAPSAEDAEKAAPAPTQIRAIENAIHPDCKIKINEGDALDLMYTHRKPSQNFDVIDLDPYGTAAPFLDAAVQSVSDGGLLLVTCTDLAVLASNNWPEKSFSLYGGTATRNDYCHEVALRLVLNAIASSAAKYGRYIQPMLSLSIDFYVRLFVVVRSGPIEVKRLASQTGIVYTCTYCHNNHQQRMGRAVDMEGKKGGQFTKFQNASAAHPGLGSAAHGNLCEECGSTFQVAGPMWLDAIHDADFCHGILKTLDRAPERSHTAPRIRGMVGTAAAELRDAPFYFTPAKVAGLMHATCPSFVEVASALLSAGFRVSRSHCVPGSLKTDATRGQVFDLIRSWVADGHPVKMENIKEGSPARKMVQKERQMEFDLKTEHPGAKTIFNPGASINPNATTDGKAGGKPVKAAKAVRYQQNPAPNWGPGTAARKR